MYGVKIRTQNNKHHQIFPIRIPNFTLPVVAVAVIPRYDGSWLLVALLVLQQ